MEEISVAGANIDHCQQCRGFWFDDKELDALHDAKDMEMRWFDIDLWQDADKMSVKPAGKPCPRCRMNLYQVSYGKSDIKADVCRVCKGVWLDGGELDNIITYAKWQGKYELLNNYGEILLRELWEVFAGPKSPREELADFLAVAKMLKYKLAAQHPVISKFIIDYKSIQ